MGSVEVSEAEHAELIEAFSRTGWTYKELANRAGVSEKSCWNVIHSHERHVQVRMQTIEQVQDALGLRVVPRNPTWVTDMVAERLNALQGAEREAYVRALVRLSSGHG
jgi:hypothetical protein